jgi:hypothetical protein
VGRQPCSSHTACGHGHSILEHKYKSHGEFHLISLCEIDDYPKSKSPGDEARGRQFRCEGEPGRLGSVKVSVGKFGDPPRSSTRASDWHSRAMQLHSFQHISKITLASPSSLRPVVRTWRPSYWQSPSSSLVMQTSAPCPKHWVSKHLHIDRRVLQAIVK